MLKTNRAIDTNAEQEMGIFLDKYLYDRLNVKYDRKTDKDNQLKGIDIVLGNKKIDEKAALSYINVPIKTFSFEISFINRANNVHQGWLFNDELETEYYMIIYPNGSVSDVKSVKAEDFDNVECLLISKKKILDYIGDEKDYILEMNDWLREKEHNGKFVIEDTYKYNMFVSQYLKEKPVNILIGKNNLYKLATRIYKVSKSELKKVK